MEMSPSQKQALIDDKIASKVIAARIIKVLPEIIHTNQTGYVRVGSLVKRQGQL